MMTGQRTIVENASRTWTVTVSAPEASDGREHDQPRVRSTRLHFQCGSACRETTVAIPDLGALSESDLLALLWGAERCACQRGRPGRMVWNVLRFIA